MLGRSRGKNVTGQGKTTCFYFLFSFFFFCFFTPPLCTKNTAENLLRQGRSTVSAVWFSSLLSWRGLWRAQKILNKGKKHCTSLRRWCFLIANPLPCPPPSSALVISVLRPSHNQTGAFWGLNFGCFFLPASRLQAGGWRGARDPRACPEHLFSPSFSLVAPSWCIWSPPGAPGDASARPEPRLRSPRSTS